MTNKHAEDSNNNDSSGNKRTYFYIKKNKVNEIFINELRDRLLLAARSVTPRTNIIYEVEKLGEQFFIKMEVNVDPGQHLLARITSGDGQHIGEGNAGPTNKVAFLDCSHWAELYCRCNKCFR
ncbi:MAG: hypothetical protein IBJ00_02020 [Alphaproteobacteria bacterium]|nr:hypothetical protein [Alphaproteobacteria bacterium]